MTKPLSHPEWNKDLGERIVWMNSRAIPSAEIRMNPPHLGPISVRVDVSDDQATVVFTAQHAAVRETLEASIPKLREMMSAQHLNLAEVNISQGSASDQGVRNRKVLRKQLRVGGKARRLLLSMNLTMWSRKSQTGRRGQQGLVEYLRVG
jgi:Flagellar hook-length control protein FliK.